MAPEWHTHLVKAVLLLGTFIPLTHPLPHPLTNTHLTKTLTHSTVVSRNRSGSGSCVGSRAWEWHTQLVKTVLPVGAFIPLTHRPPHPLTNTHLTKTLTHSAVVSRNRSGSGSGVGSRAWYTQLVEAVLSVGALSTGYACPIHQQLIPRLAALCTS